MKRGEGNGMGLTATLTLMLLVLKLIGVGHYSWWVVVTPVLIEIFILVVIFVNIDWWFKK